MIRLRRKGGDPWPWTESDILRRFHFCNIRREHDRGTQWYMEKVAGTYRHDRQELLWATALYRIVNSVDWFSRSGGVFSTYSWRQNRAARIRLMEEAGKPSSPAYLILAQPNHLTRLQRLIGVLDHNIRLVGRVSADVFSPTAPLEEVWKTLQQLRNVGPFVALQIYRDLILTGELEQDDDSFCYLGPGAQTGLQMLTGESGYRAQYVALLGIRDRQRETLARLGIGWIDPPLVLGDVEHIVCEYRKFLNLRSGKGKRRYYEPRDLAEYRRDHAAQEAEAPA
jgi:hypothetical protein